MKYKKELGEFSARVKQLRKANKLTQLDLAESLDIDVRTIKNIEAGSYNPTLVIVIGLSKAFKIEIPELFNY
ncbi:MAG TPA: helix-turn-helix transcriptional regulator [Bacteroidia bacterium]|nr:helix-turn-helix transcriptional regulator [Bacteroidia bacterium]